MIKAISYWSVQGGDGSCSAQDAIQQAKNANFQALELCVGTSGPLTPETSEADCKAYKAAAEKAGIKLESVASGMSWGCCPTSLDANTRKKAIELHKGALQRVAWLGCKSLLFVPGAIVIPWEPSFKPVPYEKAMEWARNAVTELGQTAKDLGVKLAVENVWNGFMYSPVEFAAFIDSINNPAVGAYFDVGNVLNHQQWPPHWIEILGKRIDRIHIKDFKLSVGTLEGFCDLLDGDIPWNDTMTALHRIGYDKTITAEMMPPDPTLLDRTSKAMDKILAM
ncbi:MAG: sugar phosphate isomerase/epimerase [Victivallales bacterium]|nr:sugar phosphate isomerase/epimerase [Victivallales bacterium]